MQIAHLPWRARPLLAGIAISLVAACMFGVIAQSALTDSPLVALDKTIAQDMRRTGEDSGILRPLMIALTRSGSVAAMAFLAVLGMVWEGWRGRGKWRVALGWALILIGGAFLNQLVKTALDRERPPLEWRDPVVHETNQSFPSGHAMGGTIGIGLLGYALMLGDRRWRSKLFIVLGLGAWVLAIGASRIYLRAHWFSDVLGGFALGLAWLSLGLGGLETWRRNGVRSEE